MKSSLWATAGGREPSHSPENDVLTQATAGKSEVLACFGGWGGGKLYYGAFDSHKKMTWTGPVKAPSHISSSCSRLPPAFGLLGRGVLNPPREA